MAANLLLTFLTLVLGIKAVTSKTINRIIEEAATSPDSYKLINTMPDGTTAVKIELDMLIKLEDYIAQREGKTRRGKRKALLNLDTRWQNCFVPYKYHGITDEQIAEIEKSIDCWENFTCLNFERNDAIASGDYIVFQPGTGCSSYVGRLGGEQGVFLGPGCFFKSVIIHEIGHAIGWVHEQSRPDRNNFVTIHENAIQPDKFHNYDINNNVDCLGVPYDYTSIMHYADDLFANGTLPTITTKDPSFQDIIGTANQFSFYDIKLANLMYNCAAKNNCPERTCPCGGYQASDCNCYCKGNPITLCDETCENITTTTPPTTTTSTSTSTTTTTTTTSPVCNVTVTTTPCPHRRQAEPCVDAAKNCAKRAKRGACVSKRDKMIKECRKTCNLCDAAAPVPKKQKSDVRCVDSVSNCKMLSQNNGCKTFRLWMLHRCTKACGLCRAARKPANQCLDDYSSCPEDAAKGYCKISGLEKAMKAQCRRSCGACSPL